MALTIAYEGLGVIANADLMVNDTGGLGTGDWGETGGGTVGANTDVYLRGAVSIGSTYASKSGWTWFDRVTAMNMTDTYPGQFIYVWINIAAKGAFKTLASNGFAFRWGSTAPASLTDYRQYRIAGKNDSNGWSGGWKLFVIDPTKPGSPADVGSPLLTAMQWLGVWIDTDVSVRADTVWISQIAVAKGLRITVTSVSDGWAEAVAYCTDYPNRAWGVLQEREGIYFVYGGLWIGDAASQAATCTFTTGGRVLQFGTSEYYNISDVWVTSYPNTANTLVIEDHADYATLFTDGVLVGSDSGSGGCQYIGDPNSTISMTLYTGNHASSITKMYGSTLKDILGTITLGDNTANQYFSCNFIGCGVMTLGTSSVQNTLFVSQLGLVTYGGGVLKNCSFISSTLAVALLWNQAIDTNTKLDGTLFSSSGTGHAIELGSNCPTEITFTNLTFTGYGSDETTDAAIYNNSGHDIAISLIGTTQPTVRNNGFATTFPSSRTLKIAVKDIDGNPMVGVRCYIDDNNQSPYILDDITNGDGEASVVYTGSPVTNATWRVRKYEYLPFQQLVSIASSDITLPVTLIDDPIY